MEGDRADFWKAQSQGGGATATETESILSNKMKLLLGFFLTFCCIAFRCSVASKISALFVFGDSWLDSGTNNYLPNVSNAAAFLPYGETYFGYGTGRYSDGRNLADLLAQALGLPMPAPFLRPRTSHEYGASFASAGSRLLGNDPGAVSFKVQLEQLQEQVFLYKHQFGDTATQEMLKNSAVLVAIGSNDIAAYLTNNTLQSRSPDDRYISLLLEQYSSALQLFYDQGIRKVVLVGLAPLGCTPLARFFASRQPLDFYHRRPACLNSPNDLATTFNRGLQRLIRNKRESLSDAQFVLAKPYDLIMNVMNSPIQYGFLDTTDACCGSGPFRALEPCSNRTSVCRDPSRHLFWDSVHATEAANELMLRNFWYGDLRFAEPHNLRRLFEEAAA